MSDQLFHKDFRSILRLGVAMSLGALTGVVNAQGDATTLEEIVVTGSRATVQSTINIKRNAVEVVDGLSAADIGDLPALSIGEALESITGAASHRENGGATEISIRGLGPYLSSTVFNGRVATNGSGDRSVNFSQFPSELMNKIAIYKTQSASQIEGGVAGQIVLETLRPLDYDDRRLQVDLKGNYNPDQKNIDDTMGGDLGYRGTLSFVDQFDFNEGGRLGVSVGLQRSDISQPEQEMRSSSPSATSLFACLADNDPDQGYTNIAGADDCEDNPSGSSTNGGYDTAIDPATGVAVDDGRDFAWAGSSRGFRHNDTLDERDSAFIALQWQPTDRLDINFDTQWSERIRTEDRYDLNFANMKRNTPGTTLDSLVFAENGVVTQWAGETDIDSNGEYWFQEEEYTGWGLDISYQLADRLNISADISSSETTRIERQLTLRQQSLEQQDVTFSRNSDGFVTWTVEDFDITDPANFIDGMRVRVDSDVDRENTVDAARFDLNYEVRGDFVDSVDFGFRVSEMSYYSALAGSAAGSDGTQGRVFFEQTTDADPAVMACAREFPESSFLSGADAGPLVTNIDANGDVISTHNEWAIFDNLCRTEAILAANDATLAFPDVQDNINTIDVSEDTTAFYLKANYNGNWGDTLVSGNFGARVVRTSVTSLGFREQLVVTTDPVTGFLALDSVEDTLETIEAKHTYTEVLPSASLVMDLTEDVIFRAGVFRGLSRNDPADMGYSRTFNQDESEDVTSLEELITQVSANGNPFSDPLTSWNYDLSLEWYPNDDSILAASIYLKDFTGGFENTVIQEDFRIDNTDVTLPVVVLDTNEDTSTLYGIEITASTRFSMLPAPFDGLGGKISYNHADSDFEFQDSLYGDQGVIDENGDFVQTNAGIVAPGNVPGFSEDTFSGQLYYQIGEFDASLIYKYRSEYFQPYTSDGTRLRYVGDVGVWEASASYQVNDNFTLKLQAINLFDSPKEQYFFTNDNLGEANYYGSRVFVGVQAKF